MKRRAFLLFSIIMSLLLTSMILFIQSRPFANIVKRVAVRHIPENIGINGDFSEFAIKLFPPGISIRNPHLAVQGKNIAGLPPGSSITAERLDLVFLPFQMFSGNIRISEVVVVNGDLEIRLDTAAAQAAPSSSKFNLRWDELFQVHAEAVALKNTRLRIAGDKLGFSANLVAESLRFGQWAGKSGLGYDVSFELGALEGQFPKSWSLPAKLEKIKGSARVDPSGLQIDSFSIADSGLEISGNGAIQGNILKPKNLTLGAEVKVRGPLQTLSSLLLGKKTGNDFSGDLSFDGKISGNPENLPETLKASGTVQIERPTYLQWKADSLVATAGWHAAPHGGEISVSKVVLSAQELNRSGGSRPGFGGRIEAGPFRLPLSGTQELSIPVHLERAHIHWLGAPALKDVYPLDFRVSGPILATFIPASGPGKSWNLITKSELALEGFQLDNQRLNLNRPLRKVLKFEEQLKLSGVLLVDKNGIQPQDMELSLGHSRFRLHGKVDFESGYDLKAQGAVDLSDLREIAENPIRGKGSLYAHVHGPSSAVIADLDVDLKDSFYLNLKLGALKGRISWEDDPQHLVFSQVQLHQGTSPYLGNGTIDVGDAQSIDLSFQIARGNVQDFITVLEHFTTDIWWFPKSLTGAFTGTVAVTGGLSMDKLKVLARATGSEWNYGSERFRSVVLTGGYDRGTYHIGEFFGTKRSGRILGRISYEPSGRFDWDFRTEQFNLTDFDLFAKLDVPMRGRLSVASSGRGLIGALKSETFIALTDFSVRGRAMSPSQLSFSTESGQVKAAGTALGGQGILDLAYDFKPGAASHLRAQLSELDFSPVLLLLNPRLSQDPELLARVSGAIDINFHSDAADRGTGTLDIRDFRLRKTDTTLQLMAPQSISVRDGSFDIRDLGIKGNQGEAWLNLKSESTRLEGSVFGELDIDITEFLTSVISRAHGTSALDFALGGTLREPKILGKASLSGGNLRIAAVETPFENITGAIQLRQNVITVQNLEADLAGGRIAVDGDVKLFADQFPLLDLKAQIHGPKLKIYPFQFIKVDGAITVTGSEIPYLVKGSVTSDSGLSKEKVLQQKQTDVLKSAQYMPSGAAQGDTSQPRFKLEIDARADRGILIQNDLFDAEAKGKVTVINTIETPRIVGTAELLQGKMVFKNRSFQIQSATIGFDNPAVINPIFDMTATTEVDNTKIQMYAAGRMSSWKIELSSNPVLPESEILSLLTMGISSSDARRMSSGDRSVVEQGEAASLLLHSLDFNREVHSKTGFQIQLSESVDAQSGTSIVRPQSATESAAAPKIVIKRQIGKNLDLSYGSTVGLGTNSRKEINAEYRLTPGFSVIGVWDNYETPDVQERKSYGMDLKWQKRFR